MTFSTHSASAPLFLHSLENMLSWLDKAEEHAKSSGFEANNYLGLRLTPGMLPLSRQIQIATDSAKNTVARLAGLEPPSWSDDEASLDELRARISKAIEYVKSIPSADLEGAEARIVQMPAGPDHTLSFTGEAFLTGFSIPNFFFHISMTYALLRQGGVDLGKMDYLGELQTVEPA